MKYWDDHKFTINKNIYTLREGRFNNYELYVNDIRIFSEYLSPDNFLYYFNLKIINNHFDYLITIKKEELLLVYDYLYNYFHPLEVRRKKLEKIIQKIISK